MRTGGTSNTRYTYKGWSIYVYPSDEGWQAEATKSGRKLRTLHRNYKKYEAIGNIESRIDYPRRARRNPDDTTTWLVVGGLGVGAALGLYFLLKKPPPSLPA